jgi:phosphoglycolate phosphatase-like HAD superfamily hydrolase
MPRLLNDIQLILFDIDGTLLLPKGAGRVAMRLAAEEVFGAPVAIDDHHFGGKTDWRNVLEIMASHGFEQELVEPKLTTFEAVMARHIEIIIADFPVEACPGAHVMMAELIKRGEPLPGLLTGNFMTTSPIKLRAAGFDPDWFRVGAYGSEAESRNDLPFLAVERAEHMLGRSIRPEQVVIIGDTLADVECARALGGVAVAVKTGYTPLEELAASQPDYLLDDLSVFFGQVMA